MIKFLPKYYTRAAIISFFVTLGLCLIVFQNNALPLTWIVFSIIEVIGFFYFSNTLSKEWQFLPPRKLKRKLFGYSLLIRLVWVIFAFFFFQYQTGEPFAFNAADSKMYHVAANSVLYHGFNLQSAFWGLDSSDWGFPFYLAMIYSVFGDYVIIPRFINAFLGAWSVVLIYNIATRNFGQTAGKIAGVFTMLMPNLIYYTGVHLKETLMVFIVIFFIERIDYLLRANRKVALNLSLAFLLGGVLFFFRTVLGFSVIFALFSALVLSKRLTTDIVNRILIGIWFIVILWFFMAARIQAEFDYLVQGQSQQEVNMQFRAAREGGNTLATYGTTVVFLPFMFVAPFSTLVNIEIQQQHMMLAGAYFVRNIYAFFVMLAIILMIKRKMLRKHILLISFVLSYLFILAKSSFAISERFHLPIVPFLLIFAAYGVTQINAKNKRWFIPYVILIAIIVVGWNWFKLAGRGAI